MSSLHQLYREALRALRPIPYPNMRHRMTSNIREMIEIYSDVQDETRLQQLMTEGWHDVSMLKALAASRPDLVSEMFKSFATIEHSKPEEHNNEPEEEEALKN